MDICSWTKAVWKIRKKIVDFLAGEVILHSVWLVFAASAFSIFAQSLFVSAAD